MNTQRAFLFVVFMMSLLFSCVFQSNEELMFKQNAERLKSMIQQLEGIPVKKRVVKKSDTTVKLIFDYSQRIAFLQKSKREWLSIAHSFIKFSRDFPKSKWADDSLFCMLIITKANLLKSPNELNRLIIKGLEKLIALYPDTHLEPWTKDFFEDTFFRKFDYYFQEVLNIQKLDNDRLIDLIKYSLALEYRKSGDNDKARKILNGLSLVYSGTKFGEIIEQQINFGVDSTHSQMN